MKKKTKKIIVSVLIGFLLTSFFIAFLFFSGWAVILSHFYRESTSSFSKIFCFWAGIGISIWVAYSIINKKVIIPGHQGHWLTIYQKKQPINFWFAITNLIAIGLSNFVLGLIKLFNLFPG